MGERSQDEMIRIFNQSRININLANASKRGKSIEKPMRIIEKRSESLGRHVRQAVGLFYDPIPDSAAGDAHRSRVVISKIPGCGGFLLTDQADNLADYYECGLRGRLF